MCALITKTHILSNSTQTGYRNRIDTILINRPGGNFNFNILQFLSVNVQGPFFFFSQPYQDMWNMCLCVCDF